MYKLSCCETCGILVPRPGIKPILAGGFLTTELPGKSSVMFHHRILNIVPMLYRTLLFTHSVYTSLHLLNPKSQSFTQFLAQRKCSQMSAVVPVRQETEEPCAEEATRHFPLNTVRSRLF